MSVDWQSATWGIPGCNVHVGTTSPDAHDVSEEAAEAAR